MQEETMRGKGCVPHLRGYEMREGKEERSNASDSKSNHVQQDKGEGKIKIKKIEKGRNKVSKGDEQVKREGQRKRGNQKKACEKS